MLQSFARRLLSVLAVLLLVALVVFMAPRLAPGDPTASTEPDAPLQAEPAPGKQSQPAVGPLLVQRLAPSLKLALLALGASLAVGLPLGALAAWRTGGWLARGVGWLAWTGLALPVLALSFVLTGAAPAASGSLPLWCLGTGGAALVARTTRAKLQVALASNAVRNARALGLAEWRVLWRHACLNAVRPIAAALARRLGLLISGLVLVESIFAMPGLGSMAVDAALARDVPSLQALVLALGFVCALCAGAAGAPDPLPAAAQNSNARVRRSVAVRVGGGLLLLGLAIALLAPVVGLVDPALSDPGSLNLRPGQVGSFTGPEGQAVQHRFWLGSDKSGRDLASRVVHGARLSLFIGAASATLALLVGGAIGLLAGVQRLLGSGLMRLMSALAAVPPLLLAMAVVALWRGGLATVIVAVTLPAVPRVALRLRTWVAALRQAPHAEAALTQGTPGWLVLLRHVLPSTWVPLAAQGVLIAAAAIVGEASLSFLGLGLPLDTPSWGQAMAEGRAQFGAMAHPVLIPALCLTLLVLGLHLVADGLQRAYNAQQEMLR